MLADSAPVGLYFGLGIFSYIISVMAFAGIFKKADQPIWAAFIPIVNAWFLFKTAGRPGWWVLLGFICPIIFLVMWIIVAWDLAKSFGHGVGVFVCLLIFNVLTLLYLGFGQSQYRGPAAAQV